MIKEETLAHVFLCEIFEIFKNTFFIAFEIFSGLFEGKKTKSSLEWATFAMT